MVDLAKLKRKPHVFSVNRMSRIQIRDITHGHVSQAATVFREAIPFPLLNYLEFIASDGSPWAPLDFEIQEDYQLAGFQAYFEPDTSEILISQSTYVAALDPENQNHEEALFTIAHEIGHWALGHSAPQHEHLTEKFGVAALPGYNSETQADIFAEAMLMSTTNLTRTFDTADKIGKAFIVSPARAKKRVRDLGKEGFWAGLPRVG